MYYYIAPRSVYFYSNLFCQANVELAKASKARANWWSLKASGVSTVGGAVAGGLILGPVGAIAGGSLAGETIINEMNNRTLQMPKTYNTDRRSGCNPLKISSFFISV